MQESSMDMLRHVSTHVALLCVPCANNLVSRTVMSLKRTLS